MTQGKYVELSEAQRTEVWRRWKAGESLHTIERAYARPHASIGDVSPLGFWRLLARFLGDFSSLKYQNSARSWSASGGDVG